MVRPFKDKRIIVPLIKKYSTPKRVDPDYKEYIITFHLKEDVSDYSRKERSQFANFAKSALREIGILATSYKLSERNREPYDRDKYRIIGRVDELSQSELKEIIDDVNDQVGGISGAGSKAFRVVDISFKQK